MTLLRSKLYLILLLFSFSVVLFSSEKMYFKIGTIETIDSEGIKFKGMRDCSSSPLPMPETHVFTNQKTGEKYELHDAFDLWRREQCIGVWIGQVGRIIIGKISIFPPEIKDNNQGFMLKADYDEWRKNVSGVDLNDHVALNAWLSAFFALTKLSEGEKLTSKVSPPNCVVTSFNGVLLPGSKKRTVYLLEPKSKPNAKFAICYECDEDLVSDPSKNEKAVASSLASFTFFPVKKAPSAPSPTSPSTKTIEKSPEYLASIEEVIKNIKNADGWEYTETKNFILVYNVKNKKTIKDMGENLERCRSVFESFYPLKGELKAVSVCRFFEKREDYLNYAGKEFEWTGGLWASSRKELIVSPVDWASRSDSRKMMVETAYHEGFHQYLHYAINEKLSSIWFNEGSATFFEGINFKGADKFEIETTERLENMKELAASPPEIAKMISMNSQEFISPNSVTRNYTLAWGLMFFLHKGSQVLNEKNNYAEIPRKYYEILAESGDFKKANEEAWKDIDMDKFEKQFQNFWKDDSLIRRAEKFNPIAKKKN